MSAANNPKLLDGPHKDAYIWISLNEASVLFFSVVSGLIFHGLVLIVFRIIRRRT